MQLLPHPRQPGCARPGRVACRPAMDPETAHPGRSRHEPPKSNGACDQSLLGPDQHLTEASRKALLRRCGAPKIASHDDGFKTCTWGTSEILMEDE